MLARRMGLGFVDSDQEIEARLGCSIRQYFETAGESRFRDLEQETIDQLSQATDTVLSTGGGAVLREVNRRNLRERGQVVYLKSSPDELFRRLKHDSNRPLLQVADQHGRLRELFEERDPLYRATAHFVLETGRPSVSTLVNMVVMQLELAGVIQRKDGPPR
jgi:shikimate kinase